LSTPYLPHPADLVELVTTWGVAVILMLAGTVFVGQRMPPEVQIGAGWGGLCLALTGWGVLVPLSLTVPAAGFALMALCVLTRPAWRPSRDTWKTLGRVMLVSMPLWLVMAPIQPSQPDTWINLLPNAFYLLDWGRFPTAALAPSHSYVPAAPYNTQFLSYFGGLMWPAYPAAGMSLINLLLLLTVAQLVARVLTTAPPSAKAVPSWGGIAGGVLLVTLLNPGFVPRFHLSAYGETALAVTAAMTAWLLVGAQGETAADRPPSGVLQAIGLILAAMINTKQSGIGLVAASAGAAIVTSWAESRRQRRAMLRLVGLALLPALGLYALWRYHVSVAGVNELKPLPFAQWNWGNLPQILTSTAVVVRAKIVYFGCVAAALVACPLLLRRQGWTPTTRLLTYHAALFVLYNCFLLLMYVALFPGEMSIEAHSFFRYNTHLSLVLVLSLTLVVRDLGLGRWLISWRMQALAHIALVAALLSPLVFAYRLRFDLDMPQPLVRNLANAVKPYLTDGSRLALLLPDDNSSVATVISGVLAYTPPRRRMLDLLTLDAADPATLEEAFRLGYPLALVSCTGNGWEDLPASEAVLLRHNSDGWHMLAAWPYPQKAAGQRWQSVLAWRPLCRQS
jgi:hypothetical protein